MQGAEARILCHYQPGIGQARGTQKDIPKSAQSSQQDHPFRLQSAAGNSAEDQRREGKNLRAFQYCQTEAKHSQQQGKSLLFPLQNRKNNIYQSTSPNREIHLASTAYPNRKDLRSLPVKRHPEVLQAVDLETAAVVANPPALIVTLALPVLQKGSQPLRVPVPAQQDEAHQRGDQRTQR